MNVFVAARNTSDDPSIPLATVLRKSLIDDNNYLWGKDLGIRVIKYFVERGYLFYDPETDKLMARNKLMLDVFAMLTNTEREIERVNGAIRDWDSACKQLCSGDMGDNEVDALPAVTCRYEEKEILEQELRDLEGSRSRQ